MFGEALSITVLEVIREEMGSAYSPMVQVEYETLPEAKLNWTCLITCAPERAPEIEKAFLRILAQYQQEGPNEETLNKVKKQLITGRETNLKDNGFWCSLIHGSYMYNINRDDLYDYENQVNAITANDIKELAAKYIHLDNFISVKLVPETVK